MQTVETLMEQLLESCMGKKREELAPPVPEDVDTPVFKVSAVFMDSAGRVVWAEDRDLKEARLRTPSGNGAVLKLDRAR